MKSQLDKNKIALRIMAVIGVVAFILTLTLESFDIRGLLEWAVFLGTVYIGSYVCIAVGALVWSLCIEKTEEREKQIEAEEVAVEDIGFFEALLALPAPVLFIVGLVLFGIGNHYFNDWNETGMVASLVFLVPVGLAFFALGIYKLIK